MKSPTSKHSKKKQQQQQQKKTNKKTKQNKTTTTPTTENVSFCLFVAVVLFQQYPNANVADYLADKGTLRESESNGALRMLF